MLAKRARDPDSWPRQPGPIDSPGRSPPAKIGPTCDGPCDHWKDAGPKQRLE